MVRAEGVEKWSHVFLVRDRQSLKGTNSFNALYLDLLPMLVSMWSDGPSEVAPVSFPGVTVPSSGKLRNLGLWRDFRTD